jgi:hypothetical protein
LVRTIRDRVRCNQKNIVAARVYVPIYNRPDIELRSRMITRRSLVLTSLLVAASAPLARPEPASPNDPVAIINAIYTRAAPARKPADQVVRYVFVREASAWKIDDIKGASAAEAWSIRAMLTDSLKQ